MMKICLIFTLLLMIVPVARAEQPVPGKAATREHRFRIFRGNGQPATMDELLAAAMAATVVFFGESHDDPVAHKLEEQVLQRIHRSDLALALEMFESDVQYVVDEYLAGLITEEHLIASGRAWKNYKSDYRPLVEFARAQKMPVIAANPPRRYVNRVSRLGDSALGDLNAEARRFLPPLPWAAASSPYAEKFRRVMEEARKEQEKSADPKQPLPKPFDVEKGLQAQSLWDAGMAFSIAEFLTRHPGMRVLHCNGSFHTAERLGIPEHLARYRPNTSMLVITSAADKSYPELSSELRNKGDFVIVTDPKAGRGSEVKQTTTTPAPSTGGKSESASK